MKNLGIVRRLDALGRITLPKELRDVWQFEEGTPIEMFIEEDKVVLKKHVPTDLFTGKPDNLIEYQGKMVSHDTIRELLRIADLG